MDTLPNEDFEDDENLTNKMESISVVDLPIYKYKDEIIKNVRENQVVIIRGETGCGKTTQIPQIILDEGLNNQGMIGITQPRKIAAVSMARRVAKERQCAMGKEVGYEIRFDRKCSASTKIKYMTDGILLNECVTDKYLFDYGVIIIDEAHERSVNTDVLLGLLKLVIKRNKDLKVLITSATMNIEKILTYFNGAVIMEIEGRLYPVEVEYIKFYSDYIQKACRIVEEVNAGDVEGDILIFLTGEDEIEECCEYLEEIESLDVQPLYASIEFDLQSKVFEPVVEGKRKVIIATNIAETSLTFSGVRFVIDCGYVKQSNFVSRRGIDILEVVKISKAQAEQRTGRAGRVSNGKCYRLYTKEMYDDFKEEAIPEILRKNLSGIYLKLTEFNVNPKDFEYLDKPSIEEIERSREELLGLKLISPDDKLTGIGENVVKIPVEPCLGKVIITSLSKNCSMDVIKIISMLSERYIFKRPRKHRSVADEEKKQFEDPDGDQFTLLRAYNKWHEILSPRENQKKRYKEAKKWCRQCFIDFQVMNTVDKVINQINTKLKKKFNMTNNDGGKMDIKRSIMSGYFKNIAIKQQRDSYIRVYDREVLFIHPNSSLFNSSPKIILFHEVRKTNKSYMHGVMRLDEDFIKEFPEELQIIKYPDDLNDLSKF